MNTFIVYKLTHIVSGKAYIGKHNSNNPMNRVTAHLKSQYPLGCALRKYGVEAFNLEVIDTSDNESEIFEKEIKWIEHFNCVTPNGFNLSTGGHGSSGYKPDETTRRAMSIANTGAIHNRKISDKQVIDIRTGSVRPSEWAQKLGVSLGTIYRIKNYLTFKEVHHSNFLAS